MNESINDLDAARRELNEALKAPTRGWRELEKIDRAQKRLSALKKAITKKWTQNIQEHSFGGL